MDGKVSINSISVSNLLSFGPDGVELTLEPLNVLVGPNGSGKSNFLEIFRVLEAIPRDLTQPFLRGGGVQHWQHKGTAQDKYEQSTLKTCGITISTHIDEAFVFMGDEDSLIEHELRLYLAHIQLHVRAELISMLNLEYEGDPDEGDGVVFVTYDKADEFYANSGGISGAVIAQFIEGEEEGEPLFRVVERHIENKDLKDDQSILAQRNDPESYPALHQLSTLYKGIHIFGETVFGRSSPARLPQDAALDSTFLFPDASNLALVLNDLQNQPVVMKTIIEKLKLFYERAENIITRVQGGTVQIYFQEEGLTQTVPASRLSDGTLRYLCLLVILCHPSPPPLICIEEPELGMHPDVLPIIAELLIEASQKTQLIITTHSDLLVSAIGTQHPEAIVVCEKGENGTTMKRLEPEKMREWLTRYSLGDLWLKGEIGGTRF